MAEGKLTNNWLNALLNRGYKTTPDYNPPSHGLIGAGSTSPLATDTNLEKPLPASSTIADACDAVTGWGNSDDADAETLNTTTGEYKEGTGCLNLPMTFSGGDGTWSKTVGAIDMTDEYIYLYYYISAKATYLTDTTDTVRIILGTGGLVNVNYYDTDYDNISDGWTLLVFKASNYSSQGGTGATISNVDTIAIKVKDKASVGTNNQRMDWWHYADEDDQKQTISSGYPIFDTGNKRVTERITFAATDYNGYTIKESGTRNDDASWMLASHDILTNTVTKTDKVRFVITQIDGITQ